MLCKVSSVKFYSFYNFGLHLLLVNFELSYVLKKYFKIGLHIIFIFKLQVLAPSFQALNSDLI